MSNYNSAVMSNPPTGWDTRQHNRFGIEFLYTLSGGKSANIFIPFFENPSISESKKARFVSLSPINFNDNINIYVGSDSRTFKLELKINFLHLIENNLIGLKHLLVSEAQYLGTYGYQQNVIESIGEDTLFSDNGWMSKDLLLESFQSKLRRNNFITTTDRPDTKLISIYVAILGMIRNCVKNSVDNPLLGPPLLKIRYGALYDDIICIIKSVSISDSNITYDVMTGVPLNMKVSFDLVENKNASFASVVKKIINKQVPAAPSARPENKPLSEHLIGKKPVMRFDDDFFRIPQAGGTTIPTYDLERYGDVTGHTFPLKGMSDHHLEALYRDDEIADAALRGEGGYALDPTAPMGYTGPGAPSIASAPTAVTTAAPNDGNIDLDSKNAAWNKAHGFSSGAKKEKMEIDKKTKDSAFPTSSRLTPEQIKMYADRANSFNDAQREYYSGVSKIINGR